MSEDPAAEAGDAESDEPDAAAIVDALDHPLLLFDGVCNLCNGFVRFVLRFDAAGTYRFAPLQSAVGQELLDRHDLATADFDTVVLIEGEESYTKSTAALRVLRHLDGPWPVLYPLIYLPRSLRDGVYDLVASYRYRVFGKQDACPVPEPEIRDRFANRTFD
jgi:predicted DCC family thiol-disulfide oxidoreductase YuxK